MNVMIGYEIEVRRDTEGILGKVSISMVFGVSQLPIYNSNERKF